MRFWNFQEPVFAIVDEHKLVVTAIEKFEATLKINPNLTFETSGTTVLTADRFRKHSGLWVVKITRQLQSRLNEWEKQFQQPFCEFGIRYLDILPTTKEIEDAEDEVEIFS